MGERSPIPITLARDVKIEAGHRCAIPTCRHPRVEIAHIIPWAEVQDHVFENLIALCPNCHDLYDRDKKIDRKSMLIYKANLGLLNSRYGEYERRILQRFCDWPNEKTIRLPGLCEIFILYLLKDGFLSKTREGPHINDSPSWEEYRLTDKGRLFTENWKQARCIQ